MNDTTFRPTTGFSGVATLQVSTDDLAHNGAGGAKTDSDTINVAVSPPGAIDFSPTSFTVAEGGGTVTLTAVRTGGASGAATIDYAVSAGGSATADADFTPTSGTLSFADGETSKTFAITIADDAIDELDETINVALGNPGGAGVLGVVAPTTVVTITDNDPAPTVSIGDATATEGDVATFTVTLSTASGRPVTVDFATAEGSATGGSDYTSASGTVTFAAGETSKTVAVTTLGDVEQEAAETFTVTLSNPDGATLADASGAGTINNLPNESPVPAADVVQLAPGQAGIAIAVLANDTDADGDALAVGTVTAPANGTAVLNADNTVTYTPAFGFTGADSFTYSVTDGKGGVANSTVNLTVAGNGLVVNPTNAKKQDLFVAATPGNDQVQLVRVGRQVRVLVNGADQGLFAATGSVFISGGGGNDVLTIGRLKNPVVFLGGDGDDSLTGGAKGDILVGGPGTDILNGGAGRDLIIGGDGADTINGAGGNDLLIAGTTAYDADTPDNRRALADLLAALAARRPLRH